MSAAPEYDVEPTPVESSLAFLDGVIGELSEQIPATFETSDPEAAVLLLKSLRGQRQRLAEVEAFVEANVARAYGKGKHTAAGMTLEVRGGGTWKDWEHDRLAFAVCRDLGVDPETGVMDPDVAATIDLVRSRLLNCARPSWRTTQLAALGIDPGDYATWTEGRRTVQLVEGEQAS